MPELKQLSKNAIPAALEKAERYRLLNEPAEAESICLDVLAARRAKAQLARGAPGCGHQAYEGFREAMDWFEKAEAVRPAGHDDALLRWNTCARMIEKNHLTA